VARHLLKQSPIPISEPMRVRAEKRLDQARSMRPCSNATGGTCPSISCRRIGVVLCILGRLVFLAWPAKSEAQSIQTYFPSGTAGYDKELGVTVLSRLHPLYDTPVVRLGGFVVSPSVDQSLFYNSNVNGNPNSASWGSITSASVLASSDWARDSIGASIGVSHDQLFAFPEESYTNWNVGLAGGYAIGDGLLQAAYSHQTYHQIGVNIGSVASETPVEDQIDTAHLGYTFNFSRFSVTPDLSASAYRFGTATVSGIPQNQQFLNRDVIAGGITGRYSMDDQGGLLVVLQGVTSNFIDQPPGQPSNDSKSILLLGGFDYQAKGVWRYRLLVGVEARTFQAAQFPTHTGPIAEGSVIWTPTELTTVTGTLSREIEDPQTAGTNGYTLTQARLVVDHEFLPNFFAQGRVGVQSAQYFQEGGGSQFGLDIGAGVTWLLNRKLRVSIDYNFTGITGNGSSANSFNESPATTNSFKQSLVALTLHFAL
jgi:hypothetical protein